MLSSGSASALAALAGLISGILYRTVPTFEALRPPTLLTRLCTRCFAPLLGASPASASASASAAAAAGGGRYAQVPQALNNPDVPMALVDRGGGGAAAAHAMPEVAPALSLSIELSIYLSIFYPASIHRLFGAMGPDSFAGAVGSLSWRCPPTRTWRNCLSWASMSGARVRLWHSLAIV